MVSVGSEKEIDRVLHLSNMEVPRYLNVACSVGANGWNILTAATATFCKSAVVAV
jgi:hypothetical protein